MSDVGEGDFWNESLVVVLKKTAYKLVLSTDECLLKLSEF